LHVLCPKSKNTVAARWTYDEVGLLLEGSILVSADTLVMAARQLAGRRPLYFTADVSILLLYFFSPSDLGGVWADSRQTLPHVRGGCNF